MVFCHYASRETQIYNYANPEPKIVCVDYGLLTHISEIKNNLGIDTGIVPKILVLTCTMININPGTYISHVWFLRRCHQSAIFEKYT